jgi:hypothetical protein
VSSEGIPIAYSYINQAPLIKPSFCTQMQKVGVCCVPPIHRGVLLGGRCGSWLEVEAWSCEGINSWLVTCCINQAPLIKPSLLI